MMRHLRTVAVAIVMLAGSIALPAGQKNFELQTLMDEMQVVVQTVERNLEALKDLLNDQTRSKNYATRRAEILRNLKQISIAMQRDAKRVDALKAETARSSSARSSIVNGYAAEFYAGNRLEFERAVNALKATPGPGDREAVERMSSAAATLKRTADSMRRELQKTSTPEPKQASAARLKVVKLQPIAQAAIVDSPAVVALSPVRKLELIKGLGLTAPPQGLQSEVVLSPRFPYKGQVAYMLFRNGWLDTGANTFDMRTGTCDLNLHITKKAGSVLVVVTGIMQGFGKFGMADFGPGEMGQSPWWTDIGANGEEHVPLIMDASQVGWYRIAMSVQLNGNASFKLRQIDVSYLD